MILHTSEHVNELVGVQKRPAENRKALLANEFGRGIQLSAIGLALESEFKGETNLSGHFLARFLLEALGQKLSLLHDEAAVEEVQSLERRGAAGALGSDLSAIRAIENAEDTIRPPTNEVPYTMRR